MISSIQDYPLDIFDESAYRIKRIIKTIMDVLLLNININLYFTKMERRFLLKFFLDSNNKHDYY